jgi:DNA uptake protein ComE-like DNA-binding protein
LVIEEHKIPNLIELNGADSLTLTKLNGIGPVFASRITRYRDLLGGFNNVSQLLEVYNLKTETLNSIKNYISVDSVKIRKLSLNFSDYHDFFEHPYLLHKDAKNIIGFRNKNGSFETCEDLISKNILGRETYLRIKPYIKLN